MKKQKKKKKKNQKNSNGFQVTKRKRVWQKSPFTMFSGPQLQKQQKTELWFLCSARNLLGLYISVKFQEKISNGFQITAWHDFVADGRTDRYKAETSMTKLTIYNGQWATTPKAKKKKKKKKQKKK